MTTQIALLRAVAARPDDDTPRLVYADWLDDHARSDNSYAARAEYIRLQIRLSVSEAASTPPGEWSALRHREAQLQGDHHDEWQREARALLGSREGSFTFARGFPERLEVRGTNWIATADLGASPLRAVRVNGISDDELPTLADGLRGTQITELILTMTRITDEGLVHLAPLTHLRGLDLSFTRVTDLGLAHLSTLGNLEHLDLGTTAVTAAGVASSLTLTAAAKVSGLRSAGFQIQAEPLERDGHSMPPASRVQWVPTGWKGHPGEILYRAAVSHLSAEQVAELREQLVEAFTRSGLSHGSASARVVVRNSTELGQNCLTVVGNAACLALVQAVGRNPQLGECQGVARWRNGIRTSSGGAQRSSDRTQP
ncbi:MAG TPA: TIGR02996 domain-containing protein [Urbifossiella sp.]|nr:TIGR02996 domain-containing protein [Urbifossiella sp.]